jgi:hypothetical protein
VVGSFIAVTLGYFFVCRREFDVMMAKNKELGDIMNLIIKYKGTEMESKLQEKYSEKLKDLDKKAKYV